MNKISNILMFILIIIFILSIFKYYLSDKNIVIKKTNRTNMDEILKQKIVDLPVLSNDTNNVIEFNDSFENEINEISRAHEQIEVINHYLLKR